MRLRNWKETVEPTIEETLADVHPRTLDEPFGYYAPLGAKCWVKWSADGRWRYGTVVLDNYRFDPVRGPARTYDVAIYAREKSWKIETFVPEDGNMKPDTPEVRELLRQAGYFTP